MRRNVLEEEATLVPVGSDRLVFLPYLAGERHPHTDTNASGGIHRAPCRERRAAFGAAILGGVATGTYSSVKEAYTLLVRTKKKLLADTEKTWQYAALYGYFNTLYPLLHRSYRQLAELNLAQ